MSRQLFFLGILFVGVFLMADDKVIDLGTYANTYPIKEKSFKETLREGITELNSTVLKNEVLSSIEALIDVNYDLPLSDKAQEYTKQNLYTVPYDILNPTGKVAYHKGEVLFSTMPKGIELNLCFIDARFPKIIPEISEKFGKCIYFITNNRLDNSYPSIIKNSTDGKVYPMADKYIKRFSVTVLPTKIRLYENKIDYETLDFKQMIKDFQMDNINEK